MVWHRPLANLWQGYMAMLVRYFGFYLYCVLFIGQSIYRTKYIKYIKYIIAEMYISPSFSAHFLKILADFVTRFLGDFNNYIDYEKDKLSAYARGGLIKHQGLHHLPSISWRWALQTFGGCKTQTPRCTHVNLPRLGDCRGLTWA